MNMYSLYAFECEILDFNTAWSRVISYAPLLAVTNKEVEIKEAEKRQVSFRPNPVVEIEGENLGVREKNDNNTAEPPQTTICLSQLLEFGGKRKARVEFANSQIDIAYLDLEIIRQNLFYELQINFIKVKIAEERLKIAIEREINAQKIVAAIQTQVSAGKVSPIQEKKALLSLKTAQLVVNEASSLLDQSKKQLASMWKSSCPDFDSVGFDLYQYSVPLSECIVIQSVENNVDFARAKQEIFSATRGLQLQKANGAPDINVVVGYRIFNDSNQHGWVVGAQMPIPFNRNQGNIQKARSELHQTKYQMDEILRSLTEKALVVYSRLISSFEQAEMIKEGLLAQANETFNLTEVGYQKGKVEYLDLLDSQRFFFESQEKFIEVISTYHFSKAELDRLIGAYNSTLCGL